MSKLDDVLVIAGPGFSWMYSEGAIDEKPDELLQELKQDIKALFLELVDNQEVIQIPNGRHYGHWVHRDDLMQKITDL